MANDEMMMEEEIPEDTGEEMPLEEEVAPEAVPEEEQPPATVMTHTVDEIPELEGLGVGDSITMVISNVTDDGKYELQIQTEAPVPMEAPPEGIEGVPGGTEGLTERMI